MEGKLLSFFPLYYIGCDEFLKGFPKRLNTTGEKPDHSIIDLENFETDLVIVFYTGEEFVFFYLWNLN